MTSVTLDVLRVYQRDFLAFAADLVIPSARGVARFGDVWADFQVERFKALARPSRPWQSGRPRRSADSGGNAPRADRKIAMLRLQFCGSLCLPTGHCSARSAQPTRTKRRS